MQAFFLFLFCPVLAFIYRIRTLWNESINLYLYHLYLYNFLFIYSCLAFVHTSFVLCTFRQKVNCFLPVIYSFLSFLLLFILFCVYSFFSHLHTQLIYTSNQQQPSHPATQPPTHPFTPQLAMSFFSSSSACASKVEIVSVVLFFHFYILARDDHR